MPRKVPSEASVAMMRRELMSRSIAFPSQRSIAFGASHDA
jgi:hypothetical protein